ncbi:MAG: glycosyltransferase family 4 protein [Thaumarchaeota archaeon]|nr:glycosyltransferase family 4 protein [Nitrososphaerota archaeon]
MAKPYNINRRTKLADFGVMMLSWEFPPRIIGGIAPHVYELSKALVRMGISVYVVTCDFPGAPDYELVEGVRVYRVDSYKFPTPDFATWTAMMNVNMQTKATEVLASIRDKIHVLHAHDWLVANACIGLKHIFRIPLLATIHSTEHGRRKGIHDDYQRMISSTEAWLTREAWRVVCCSSYMAQEVKNALFVPDDRIDVIPNGINTLPFEVAYDREAFRSRYARPAEKLVLYVGRFVHEKGVSLLVEAVPKVLHNIDARFVMVGEGYMKDTLIKRVDEMGVAHKVHIPGFLDTDTVRLLFRTADVCVIPSLYEPFGIVALEATAARAPIVTTGVGGLGEILEHNESAIVASPTVESLAGAVTKILKDPTYAGSLSQRAYERVMSLYRWDIIADSTRSVYERVINEYRAGIWKP